MSDTLVFVIGTRAQLIKVAPVVVACEKRDLPCLLLMTGQHHETMQDLIDEFGVRSRIISVLPASEHATVGSLFHWLPAAYKGVRAHLTEIGGDQTILVHGDTLSTLIGAFAGQRNKAQVVHLESGLSSGSLFDPFPEEICRRLVFRMTDVAMCPNEQASEYMRRRYRAEVVDTAGNSILDAIALTGAREVQRGQRSPYLVVSLHRFQNLYNRFRLFQLVSLVKSLSSTFTVHFVLHPATRTRLEKRKLMSQLEDSAGVRLAPRMGYSEFLCLAVGADCVLTDGGSNQEELAALGVPTIIMRAKTERPEGLGANAAMEADLREGVLNFLLEHRYERLRRTPEPILDYGPSARIAESLSVLKTRRT